MEKLTVGITYGRALFEAAKDRGKTDEIGEEYKTVSDIFSETPSLNRLFSVPTVTIKDKKAVAQKVFGGRISEELLNFIFILIDKRRVGSWEGIGREYERCLLEEEGLAKGVLYSVLPVGSERIKAFEEKTAAMLGKRVHLVNHIDETLIGGVKMYVDGKLIDASVKARLESMKQRIKQ